MVAITIPLVLLGLLGAVHSRTTPSRTWQRKEAVAAAPAIPTATLLQDFKKNNVTAQWAEGHPKQWGQEDAKFEYPIMPNDYFAAALSEDEKFIVLSNGTTLKVIRFDTAAVVSIVTLPWAGASELLVISVPGGGYDVLANSYNVNRVRLDADGIPVGEPTVYAGKLSTFDDWPLSKDNRRFLTILTERSDSTIYAFDLDNRDWNLTLRGHTDSVMSTAFSPDGKYISTAAWDGTLKVWNAKTGELVTTLGNTNAQNWHTNFSPDGKWVTVGTGRGKTYFYEVGNFTAPPVIVGDFTEWIRSGEWSPDNELFVAGAYGLIQVYSLKERKIIQTWQNEDQYGYEVWHFRWYGDAGSRKLSYRTAGGLEVYDFEKNVKYRWGPGDLDRFSSSGSNTFLVKSKGWIGGGDSDNKVRFWKYTA